MSLKGAEDLIQTCLEHTDDAMAWCQRSEGIVSLCDACDASALVYHIESFEGFSAHLCRGHVHAFLSRSLDPLSMKRLATHAGNPERVFLLHRRYYDPSTGVALQPLPVGAAATAEMVTALVRIPDDPPFSIMTRMQQDYESLTGLPLDPDMARLMVESLIADERETRARSVFPSAARLEGVRAQLMDIFQEEDPQGVAALRLESQPYLNEAVALSGTLHGNPEDTAEGLLPRLLKVFGGAEEEPTPDDIERYRPLARAISVEICAPLAAERARLLR